MLSRIGSRVSRETSLFVAAWTLVLGVVLMVVSFTTAEQRVTRFGTALMPDFAAMYVAGTMLERHGPDRLYDFPLQENVRRAEFPRSPASERLPYVYAPWFAYFWTPVASVSYETAGKAWLLLSLVLMAGGFACLARACPELSGRDMTLVALMVLSFEPFLFECWINGQVSSFPFFCLCAALMFERRGNPVAAGMMLALLTYKPMQPPLLFALLLIGGRWKTLAGVALGGVVLFAVCASLYGPGIVLEYPQKLLDYGRLVSPTNGEGAQLRFWKYTDLQTATRLLGPPLEKPAFLLAVPFGLFLAGALVRLWRRSAEGWAVSTRHAWAATLILLPILNFYFAIYDMVLAVPGVVLAATLVMQRDEAGSVRLPDHFLGLLAVVYLAGLMTPSFETIRVNLLTLALIMLGWRVLRDIPSDDRAG